MYITEHFDSTEFDQPARHGFNRVAYPAAYYPRLTNLCQSLEVIRVHTGPLVILSGYRSKAYNAEIKGAKDSQHVQGRAADIVAVDRQWTPAKIYSLVLKLHKEGKLPYVRGVGKYKTFTHVDVRTNVRLVTWSG